MMSSKPSILFDAPVSNHGARARIIIKGKNLTGEIEIKSPMEIGGLKGEEFMKLNPLGKMPVLITSENYTIPESDTIAKYLIEKYKIANPDFLPRELSEFILNEKITRLHDIYISPIQGCMYKAAGTPFGIYGTDRVKALEELKKLLHMIENEITTYRDMLNESNNSKKGSFLCGDKILLSDATLFPTIVFCHFMLPQFFGWEVSDFLGPNLWNWFQHLSNNVSYTAEVKKEIELSLVSWKDSGRFIPIIEEMNKVRLAQ